MCNIQNMKAYTLRIEEELLNKLKHISIEERKTIRELLIELIHLKISESEYTTIEEGEVEKVASILTKIEDNQVFHRIREDRER